MTTRTLPPSSQEPLLPPEAETDYQRETGWELLTAVQEGLSERGKCPSLLAMAPMQRIAGLKPEYWFSVPIGDYTIEITSCPEQREGIIPCWYEEESRHEEAYETQAIPEETEEVDETHEKEEGGSCD